MAIVGLNQVQSRGGQTDNAQTQPMGKEDFLRLLAGELLQRKK